MKSPEKNRYMVLILTVEEKNRDLISYYLFEQGCSGIEEISDNRWKVYFPGNLDETRQQELRQALSDDPFRLPENRLLFTREETRDWMAEWKAHFKPLRVGRRILVTPPWEQTGAEENLINLKIDPQMAFGTGHHATTQMMMELLEDYLEAGFSVLDAGTGSGILAILAKKLGALSVFAYDTDPEAIDNARHNAALNQVNRIEFVTGDETAIPAADYDMILANINRNVLLGILPKLVSCLKENGWLLLSGLLDTDKKAILAKIPVEFRRVKELRKEEWVGLVLQK